MSASAGLRECFEKRLLRETRRDLRKARRSVEMAELKLERARLAFRMKLFDLAIVSGYTAMFHAARGLLYRDGVQEKSHYCLVLYLRVTYAGRVPIRLVNSMDNFRVERHEILYGLEFTPTREDAEVLMKDAKDFIQVVKELLK